MSITASTILVQISNELQRLDTVGRWDEKPQQWTWWRHQMETFSALLALCAGNSPVPGEFPAQRPVTRSFDVFFDLRLNKRLSKQPLGWWFETPAWSLWRHRNGGHSVLIIMGILACTELSSWIILPRTSSFFATSKSTPEWNKLYFRFCHSLVYVLKHIKMAREYAGAIKRGPFFKIS